MAKTRTVGDVLTSAYITLNDVGGVRYTQAQAVGYINDALQLMMNKRPDLFIGSYETGFTLFTAASTASVLPVDDKFFRPIVDYVIARCETMDADHVTSGRVATFAQFVEGFLS